MSMWHREALLGVALVGSACAIPYPIVNNAGPAEVPPTAAQDPLGAGAKVQLVTAAPPGCRSLGLATGVGGIRSQYEASSDARYAEFRAEAFDALRNAVAEAGGTHVRMDAEVRQTERVGLTYVVVRGAAFSCG
jgi:hypothetical protein